MKKIIIVVSILLVIAAGVFLYLRNNRMTDLEPYFKQKINDLVMKASGGLYHLTIEKLETNVVNSKIILLNAHLYPDTAVYALLEKQQKAPNDIFEVSIHQLAINDITPSSFVGSNTIELGRLFIDNPVVKVWHKKHAYNVSDEGDSSKTVYQLIQKDVKRIKIDSILLNNVSFIYTNRSRQDQQTRLLNVKLVFSDILMDSTTQFDRQRFFFTKTGLISLKDYAIKTGDSLYRITMQDIQIQTHTRSIQVSQLKFTPRLSRDKFYNRVKSSKDIYDVAIGQVNLLDIDWWTSIAEESLLIHRVDVKNGDINIYKDRTKPAETDLKVGKYPHQLLMKAPLQMKIDWIQLSNINLAYTELNPKSGKKGTVHFSRINSTISHITNIPEEVKRNAFCRIQARAFFMKKAPMKAEFLLDLLNYQKGNFSVNASMGAIKGTDLNDITIPMGLVKINSASIKSLEASIKGNNYSAAGTVKLLYNDLNITALKDAGDTLKKRKFLSFIANTFVLKKENPKEGQPARIENAGFQRDAHKSFFNLVWKTIFTGAGKTIGYKVKK